VPLRGAANSDVYEGRMLAVLSSASTLSAFNSVPLAKMGACPKGSFKSSGACSLCPVAGQSSTGTALSGLNDCFCPTGFFPSQTAAGCVGQELGGPNAVSASVAAFPQCPLGKALSGGVCVDCPVGSWPSPSTSYGSACTSSISTSASTDSVS
jgi:hypothetical protein